MTVSALIELYGAEGCFIQRGIRRGEAMTPTTKAYTLARLKHHVLPLLGNTRVSDLSEADIERFARDVAAGRTAKDERALSGARVIVRGGQGAARKVVRDLSAVLSFAQRRRIISGNPVAMAGVRKSDNQRTRYLTIEEVRKLGVALDALGNEGANPMAIDITRLWALTGARRNEIAGLRWDEIDFGRGLLVLSETKTGRSIRPLGAAAMILIKDLQARAGNSPFVFPAIRGLGHYQGTKGVWPKIVARSGLTGITPHVLRHSVASPRSRLERLCFLLAPF